MNSLVVVDVETTGFGSSDRVVEIAAVVLDPVTGETVDEYDTLVNPERDVGPTGVHGITASMVEAAPVFAEIAVDLGRQLNGNVLIGHNVAFDARMLGYEFQREGVYFDKGQCLCTLRETRQKLEIACREHGIPLSNHHRALADARATAELTRCLRLPERGSDAGAVRIGHIPHPAIQRTLRRGLADGGTSPMRRIVSRARYPHADEALCQYLSTLDWVLDDGVIDRQEQDELDQLAHELGIPERVRQKAHWEYFRCIVAAAKRDGVVTIAERDLIAGVAAQLCLRDAEIPEVTSSGEGAIISVGSRICFTGSVVIGSEPISRATLEGIAERAGFRCVRSVSKSRCDCLVAADTSSMSSKARTARKLGVPVISASEFLAQFGAS